MTEHVSDDKDGVYEYQNLYEYSENIQRALDAVVKLGVELSAKTIPSEELAVGMKNEVDARIGAMMQNGVDISRAMLRVGGPAVRKLNFVARYDENSENLTFVTAIDPKQPVRSLAPFEEQLFHARSINAHAWRDEAAECWRVGVNIWGDDPEAAVMNQTASAEGFPLLTTQSQPHMNVRCNEFTQIEVDMLARRRERGESIASLRGRVDNGIVRMLKVIDREMNDRESPEYVNLKNVQYLRLLGKYGMSITEPRTADSFNSAIGRVLDRQTGVIVAGKTYEAGDQLVDSMHAYAMTNGLVADVIPHIPISTQDPVGPSLVMIGRDGKLDDPKYVPLKDIQQLKY